MKLNKRTALIIASLILLTFVYLKVWNISKLEAQAILNKSSVKFNGAMDSGFLINWARYISLNKFLFGAFASFPYAGNRYHIKTGVRIGEHDNLEQSINISNSQQKTSSTK